MQTQQPKRRIEIRSKEETNKKIILCEYLQLNKYGSCDVEAYCTGTWVSYHHLLKRKTSKSFEREHINGNITNSESEETEARKTDILGQESHQKRKQSSKGLNETLPIIRYFSSNSYSRIGAESTLMLPLRNSIHKLTTKLAQ